MLPSNTAHQTSLFGTDLLQQLDILDPLLQLSSIIPWSEFEQEFAQYYTPGVGRPTKPIRLMVGLLLLKSIENLSDEKVVVQFKRNSYFQAFCGLTEFSLDLPCDSTELVHFRKRIGEKGFDRFLLLQNLHFQYPYRSKNLPGQCWPLTHGKAALEEAVNIDTTVQEKAITYPTDAKFRTPDLDIYFNVSD